MGKNNSKQSTTDSFFPEQSDAALLKDLFLQCLNGEDEEDVTKPPLQKQNSTSSTITQNSTVNYFLEHSLCIIEMPCGDFHTMSHTSSWRKLSFSKNRKDDREKNSTKKRTRRNNTWPSLPSTSRL